MNRILLPFLFCISFGAQAQETTQASVEKSVWSVESGLVGFWVNHELGISQKWALRTEIGTELYTVVERNFTGQEETHTVGAAVVSAEPKFYYNLGKRLAKGRNIAGNSGNAFSLKLNYNPPVLLFGSDKADEPNHLSVIPKWSIRRVYGKHFIMETGIGVGPSFYLANDNNYTSEVEVFVDLMVRIGYKF